MITRQSQDEDGVLYEFSAFCRSDCNLQYALVRFPANCEAAGVRVSTPKSKAMVLCQEIMHWGWVPVHSTGVQMSWVVVVDGQVVWCGGCSNRSWAVRQSFRFTSWITFSGLIQLRWLQCLERMSPAPLLEASGHGQLRGHGVDPEFTGGIQYILFGPGMPRDPLWRTEMCC